MLKQWLYHAYKKKQKTASLTTPMKQTTTISTSSLSWKEKIRKISNIASIICVLDCTLLPICTVLLPLLGMGFSAERARWIHSLGHYVAMYFVLPVGTLTTVLNYLTHKSAQIVLMASLGLLLIYNANYDIHDHHSHHDHLQQNHHYANSNWSHDVLHLNCGTFYHRISNIMGCTLLMGSNYLSRQRLGKYHHGHDYQGQCYCTTEQQQQPLKDSSLECRSYHKMQQIRNRGSALPLFAPLPPPTPGEGSSSSDIALPLHLCCQPVGEL